MSVYVASGSSMSSGSSAPLGQCQQCRVFEGGKYMLFALLDRRVMLWCVGMGTRNLRLNYTALAHWNNQQKSSLPSAHTNIFYSPVKKGLFLAGGL